MEIADVFVVNKSDRPGADKFVKDLRIMLAPAFQLKKNEIPIIKTIATEKKGIDDLIKKIEQHESLNELNDKKIKLLTEKAYRLIEQKRMHDINKTLLAEEINKNYKNAEFNLYRLIEKY
jgi:LAO/AO transport system kinase